jgi:broad specificity phosphatase PhoE
MKVYLVHPGENEFGNLTSDGTWQIKSVARRFLAERLDVGKVYVNGNNISKQSGNILSKALLVPIVSDERFIEVTKEVVYGNIKDLDVENLGYIDLFADEIVNRGGDVIIIVGGGVHRVVISRLTGMSLPETRHFTLSHGGVSVLEYDDCEMVWKIECINDKTHLIRP